MTPTPAFAPAAGVSRVRVVEVGFAGSGVEGAGRAAGVAPGRASFGTADALRPPRGVVAEGTADAPGLETTEGGWPGPDIDGRAAPPGWPAGGGLTSTTVPGGRIEPGRPDPAHSQ